MAIFLIATLKEKLVHQEEGAEKPGLGRRVRARGEVELRAQRARVSVQIVK
jgi:hypothetical protein